MFTAITGLIASYPHFAYASVFVLALSEAVPLVGVVVPGTAVIIAISALVPSGVVTLWPLLIAATMGAITGDGLSFWLGHRHHAKLLSFWPLRGHPETNESDSMRLSRSRISVA